MRYIKNDINQASLNGNNLIPKYIRDACFAKFNSIPNFDIPDICGQLEHTKVYFDNNLYNDNKYNSVKMINENKTILLDTKDRRPINIAKLNRTRTNLTSESKIQNPESELHKIETNSEYKSSSNVMIN